MRQNHSLLKLHLNNNPCGTDGGRHLMVMLQDNEELQNLGLVGCSFVGKARPAASCPLGAQSPSSESDIGRSDRS